MALGGDGMAHWPGLERIFISKVLNDELLQAVLLIAGDDAPEDHFDYRIEDLVGRAGKSVVIAATNINLLYPSISNALLS